MDALTALIDEIRHCRLCEPHLPLGARPVLQAQASARILLVGQAPGTKVHQTGIPWNDPSGDRLRDWLEMDRAAFYNDAFMAIVPMGFCYPGKGPSGDLPPRPECARHWRARLHRELPNIQLTLLVGQYAQQYYLGQQMKGNLTATVAAFEEYLPHFFPLPHPSPRNRLWLKRNDWFESGVLPALRACVRQCGQVLP